VNVRLEGVGKRFNTEWIFRDISFSFGEGEAVAILGRNGSGKSTLLQIIAGNLHPTSGSVTYELGGKPVDTAAIFPHVALVAPYLEIIEDFTLREMLDFHFAFKRYLPGHDRESVTGLLRFPSMRQKQIRHFSSGMKQRLKLVLAILSDVPLLLLDEPTMNLDRNGIEWYLELISGFRQNRTLVICSNLKETESAFAVKALEIENYKQNP